MVETPRSFNIRDRAGYLVFATDDPREFLEAVDSAPADHYFEGADPEELRNRLRDDEAQAAQAIESAPPREQDIAARADAIAADLTTDTDLLTRLIAVLEAQNG